MKIDYQVVAGYFLLLGVASNLLELYFFGRYTGERVRGYHYVLYAVGMNLGYYLQRAFELPEPLGVFMEIGLLFAAACLLLRTAPVVSAVGTVLSVTTFYLSSGLVNSVFSGFFHTIPMGEKYSTVLLFLSMFSGLLVLPAAYGTFRLILKSFSAGTIRQNPTAAVLLFPILLVLLVVSFIWGSVYGGRTVVGGDEGIIFPQVPFWQVLLIHLFAYICLVTVLYAYRKVADHFSMATRCALLEQQARTQQEYIREARQRYDQTQSFRHDLKNHLVVLDGLLKRNEVREAQVYLGELGGISDPLSFPCKTGNPAVDVLLSSKLAAARQSGIRVECGVYLPCSCGITDIDLCIVFSNAVDNAVTACGQLEPEKRRILISAKQKKGFLVIQVENSCLPQKLTPPAGTGIQNMRMIAQRYQGALTAELEGDCYKLNLLFSISQHPESISQQTG